MKYEDETKQLIYIQLNAKVGTTRQALEQAIDEATKRFSSYRIFPDPRGLVIEGTLGEDHEDSHSY